MRTRLIASGLILALVVLPSSGCGRLGTGNGQGGGTAETTRQAAPGAPGSVESTSAFVVAAEQVTRVVVNVGVQQGVQGSRQRTTVPAGNGSGIVIRPDGYILTNNHVVENAEAVTAVIGSDTVPARIVGRDPSTDLAVIKVDRTGLETATIGDPESLQIGEWVIAVGTPFGLARTVTAGIVSAKGRSTVDAGPSEGGSIAAYTDLIQTDAAINPGNSGGALARLDGSVVGVNTLIESGSGVSSGVGFAIPIDFAMSIADQLIENGRAVHPFLGVGIVSLSPFVAEELNVEATSGVLVQEVMPGSAASRAGIRQGDVIVELDGEPIVDASDLYAVLRRQRIGDQVAVVVLRDRKRVTLEATVGSDKDR